MRPRAVGATRLRAGLAVPLAAVGFGLGSACADDGAGATADTADVAVTAADADVAARPDTPTPWIFEDDAGGVAPSLEAEALASVVTAALDEALEVDPDAVRNLQDLLFPPPAPGTGDVSGCPFFLTYDYGEAKAFYWQGECTAPDGTTFSGNGYANWYADFQVDFGRITGYEYSIAGRIEAPDGTWLEGTGTASRYDGGGADIDGFARGLDGTFRAGGPRAPQSPWLDGSRRPSLAVTGWRYLPTGGKNLAFSGGIGGLSGLEGGVTAVALDELTVRTITAGASCQKEFGGSASVRGPDGSWYDIVFDGPTEAEPDTTSAEDCDGCGATFFRGGELSATCIDPAAFVSWETRPW